MHSWEESSAHVKWWHDRHWRDMMWCVQFCKPFLWTTALNQRTARGSARREKMILGELLLNKLILYLSVILLVLKSDQLSLPRCSCKISLRKVERGLWIPWWQRHASASTVCVCVCVSRLLYFLKLHDAFSNLNDPYTKFCSPSPSRNFANPSVAMPVPAFTITRDMASSWESKSKKFLGLTLPNEWRHINWPTQKPKTPKA